MQTVFGSCVTHVHNIRFILSATVNSMALLASVFENPCHPCLSENLVLLTKMHSWIIPLRAGYRMVAKTVVADNLESTVFQIFRNRVCFHLPYPGALPAASVDVSAGKIT